MFNIFRLSFFLVLSSPGKGLHRRSNMVEKRNAYMLMENYDDVICLWGCSAARSAPLLGVKSVKNIARNVGERQMRVGIPSGKPR